MIEIGGSYKRKHKPQRNSKFKQGYFYPKNPEKWVTKTNEYRSSWEFKIMDWLDRNEQVLRVGSEPCAIQYRDPVANLEYCHKHNLDPNNPQNWKIRKYYVDLWVEYKTKKGEIKKIFIEIKPLKDTKKPEPLKPGAKLKEVNAFNRAMKTFLTNQAKWKAAKYEFNKRGCEFQVWTEEEFEKLHINL